MFPLRQEYMSIIEYGKKKRRVLYGEKVLLTGFDPFGGETVNPSWEAVKRLNGAAEGPASIVSEQVPTVFISLLPCCARRSKASA